MVQMSFDPIETERLLLRPVRLEDAEALASRRSEPDVARYQSWTLHFPLDRARAMVEEFAAYEWLGKRSMVDAQHC